MIVAGLDGCKTGWVVVARDLRYDSVYGFYIISHIADLLSAGCMIGNGIKLATVDIPIGLTDEGPRQCDIEARRILGPRSSSVFPSPIRPMLEASDYWGACAIGQNADGRKLSKQAWNILPKIKQVDQFVRSNQTTLQIREVHPEVCFAVWKGMPMSHPKRTPSGRHERELLITRHFGRAYYKAQQCLPKGKYANDDLLDAFVALWTAERVVQHKAITLPDAPPIDSCGLTMEMVA